MECGLAKELPQVSMAQGHLWEAKQRPRHRSHYLSNYLELLTYFTLVLVQTPCNRRL